MTAQTPDSVKSFPLILGSFLRDPLGYIRRPLNFTWPLIFFILAAAAFVSGGISGAINRNSVDVLLGIFVFPVTSVVTALVFGFFVYYFFSLFRATFLDFRRLMSLVSMSLIPYFLFHSVSSYLVPIDLLGFAFTCVLLIVGLVEQFQLDRKLCSKLVGSMALLFFIAWSFALYRNS